jgi:hypothetical protein
MSKPVSGSIRTFEELEWSLIEPIPEYPEHSEWFAPAIFDINMPIHPTYKSVLNPELAVGDLVETYMGEIGLVVEKKEPENIALRINDANNNTYTVLIGDQEKVFIGYSLKKVKKTS